MKTRHIHTIRLLWLVLFLVFALLAWGGIAGADDAPILLMSGGASPRSRHDSIRMDSENVTIGLQKNTYTVDAVFHFFNSGTTTTEWVGFPKRGRGYADMFHGTNDFIRFETWVNGEKAAFSEERSRSWGAGRLFRKLFAIFAIQITDDRWLVKHVAFPGHATTTTRVRYEARYNEFADSMVAYYITLLVHTGKTTLAKRVSQ
jgi:hypothetical protein